MVIDMLVRASDALRNGDSALSRIEALSLIEEAAQALKDLRAMWETDGVDASDFIDEVIFTLGGR